MTATPDQIAHWKKQHRSVYGVSVRSLNSEGQRGDSLMCYLREPTIGDLRKAARRLNNASRTHSGVTAAYVFRRCWLGGDEAILANETLTAFAAAEFVKLAPEWQASYIKL